ncbi:hypothetical protein [Demequina muriae]|uniref:Uncharacterized protein n=1 Tax=Demequina muriae TaxID=3051664 RepID=A0ABT8GGW1_9MICO|nr:hypothetical protein [Demequina sp. EGI L300058]MDN4480181.1 hypothetical protein [Demequina sp. EGI L300058]
MKLGTKILATLAAAALAIVGWAVPSAYADSTDSPNTAGYWEKQYPDAVKCWKFERAETSSYGAIADDAEGTEGVKLAQFDTNLPGDRWEVLIVKGGDERNVYERPNAGEVYHAPLNGGDNVADVSHWIVCGGADGDDWRYDDPTCTSLTVDYPEGVTGDDVNVRIKGQGADAGAEVTLNFHSANPWPSPTTFAFTEHANWPGWAEWAVDWVQVDGTNYHWDDNLSCGEPAPEPELVDICVWNADKGVAEKTAVETAGDDILWSDGTECTPQDEPELVDICVWNADKGVSEKTAVETAGDDDILWSDGTECTPQDDPDPIFICVWNAQTDSPDKQEVASMGNGDVAWVDGTECAPDEPEEPQTVAVCDAIKVNGTIVGWERADKTPAEAANWPYFDWNPELPNNGCWYETFVCWEVTATDFQMAGGLPVANEKLFTPKQEFVMEAASFAELQDCWDYVAECGTTTWYQLDRYIVHNYSGNSLLERLKVDGLGQEYRISSQGIPVAVGPEDAPIQRGYQFRSAVGDECAPPEVTICAQDGDTWYGLTVPEDQLPAEYIVWTGDPEDCFTTEPSLDGSTTVGVCIDGAPYLDYTIRLTDPDAQVAGSALESATLTFVHPTDSALDHAVEVDLAPGTTEWSGSLLWPGASLDPAAWPGWEQLDNGTYVPVGEDNFGWTRGGVDIRIEINPEITLEGVLYPDASPVCDTPPPVDICVWDGSSAQQVTLYGSAPEGAVLWDGTGAACTPTVDICVEGDASNSWTSSTIPVNEFKGDMRLWDSELAGGGCGEPQQPTLDGSLISEMCIADSPWISYDVRVFNPDNLPLEGVPAGEEPVATMTFINPNGEDHVIDNLPLGSGSFLWPGAEIEPAEGFTVADIDPSRPETFVATNWPGWFQDDAGDWVEVTDPQDLFAWTRNGVQVTVEVNPVDTFTINYPPPTPTCAARPPEEFTSVLGALPLDAPAATPVVAEATYTG